MIKRKGKRKGEGRSDGEGKDKASTERALKEIYEALSRYVDRGASSPQVVSLVASVATHVSGAIVENVPAEKRESVRTAIVALFDEVARDIETKGLEQCDTSSAC